MLTLEPELVRKTFEIVVMLALPTRRPTRQLEETKKSWKTRLVRFAPSVYPNSPTPVELKVIVRFVILWPRPSKLP